MRKLGALLVCACLVSAGCIGNARAGTAMETREEADEQAERFAGPDAELIEVTAAEMNTTDLEDSESDTEDAMLSRTDERIGDGEAPAWMYTYQTSELTYRVTVAHDGTVLANETSNETDPDATPIGEWSVSSEEAAEIVDENNDTWTTDADGFGFYALERDNETEDPIWGLAQFTPDHAILAAVNASTGEFLGAHPFSLDFDFGWSWSWGWGGGWGGGWSGGYGWSDGSSEDAPPQEGGTFEDRVTLADDTHEHEFEIEAPGHPRLGVGFQPQAPGAGDLNVTVEGPDGELGSFESATSTGPESHGKWWGSPEAGDYTITVELTDGAERGYTIDWCAEGEQGNDQEAREACEAIFGSEDSQLLAEAGR